MPNFSHINAYIIQILLFCAQMTIKFIINLKIKR